jgi:hypothetical protein
MKEQDLPVTTHGEPTFGEDRIVNREVESDISHALLAHRIDEHTTGITRDHEDRRFSQARGGDAVQDARNIVSLFHDGLAT